MVKKLKEVELLKINIQQLEQKLIKQEIELAQKDLLLLKAQQEHLKLRASLIDVELFKTNDNIKNLSNKLSSRQVLSKSLNDELEEKYKLTPGWGYNPDTGEIVGQ